MKKIDARKIFGCKTVNLSDGTELHVHMANNRGRGDSNVTLTRVRAGTARHAFTRQYLKTEILSRTLTSGWSGIVNFSARVREELNEKT